MVPRFSASQRRKQSPLPNSILTKLCIALMVSNTLLISPGCDSQTKPSKPTDQNSNLQSNSDLTQQQPDNRDESPNEQPAPEISAADNLPEPNSNLRFRLLESGPDFAYRNGEEAGHVTMLETLGGGIAIFDYDADGWMDLLCTGGGRFGADEKEATKIHGYPPALYRNNGDLTFTDVTEQAGIARDDFYSHGALAQDYDNDGLCDVVITGYGGLLVFHNNGDGTFSETAEQLQLPTDLWSVGAAWGDIDNDGTLELYVAQYIDWTFANHPLCTGQAQNFLSQKTVDQRRDICSPRDFAPLPDHLFKFNEEGILEDISTKAGITQAGKGLGVLMADMDLDGDLDIYVTNDTVSNFLWTNQGDGTFEETATLCGVGFDNTGNADGSMGIDLGDFNMDGLPDLFVTNFQNEQFALYKNIGNSLFQHVSSASGLLSFQSVYVGWGTTFIDADRDGDEDLFIANGHVKLYPNDSTIAQWPIALENIEGRFAKVNKSVGEYFTSAHKGRGMASGDLDNDGDLDLIYSHINQRCSVLINETENDNQWFSIKLIGQASNRAAVGARITLITNEGKQVRQIKGGGSYASSHDARTYFGIPAGQTLEQVLIHWPNGDQQTIESAQPNSAVTIIQPKSAS
ncbi:MAG: hypothetical protein CMM03_14930 [Rhodopirellula sp.]|nr:hypothetical protein [Rhodopirellula sp.]